MGIDLSHKKTTQRATPEVSFWAEFSNQIETWRQLEALPFHNEVNHLLKQYFPKGVVIEIEGEPRQSNVRLVFSSNGDVDYFSDIMRLVHTAPTIQGFSYCAFRQSMALKEGMAFSMNGISLHIGELLAQYGADGARIGLSIAFTKTIPADTADTHQQLAFIVLDHLLGEWSLAVKVGFIEFINHSDGFDKSRGEVVPLAELPKKLEHFWQKELGHSGQFPTGEGTVALLSAYGKDQDPNDENGNILICVNRSANAVACRADLMYQLHISGTLGDQNIVNYYYDLEEQLSQSLAVGEQGIFACRITDMGEGHWQMYYYVQEPEMAQAIAQALVAKIFPRTSPVDVVYKLDPRWLGYMRFA